MEIDTQEVGMRLQETQQIDQEPSRVLPGRWQTNGDEPLLQ